MNYKASVNEIVQAAHENAVNKGFYDSIGSRCGYLDKQGQKALSHESRTDFVLSQLAMVLGEGGEAIKAIQRRGIYSEEFGEELADIVIRVCDLAGYLDINLGKAIHRKMEFNQERPRLHGKLR